MQALTLQGQVKTQADKDVAAYEAEWRQLTHIVEQDRRDREAQRARELAAREEQMAQLFQQEFRAGEKRRAAARTPPGSAAARPAAEAPAEEAVSTATSAPERIKQLKAALAEVLEATGVASGRGSQPLQSMQGFCRHTCRKNSVTLWLHAQFRFSHPQGRCISS